jgi:hypothetical protein
MFRKIPLIILLLVFAKPGFSQKAKTHVLTTDEAKMVKKDASSMFFSENFDGALAAYKDLYKSDPKNVDYNFKLGYCYLMTNENKKASLEPLQYAAQSKDAKKEWLYFLGQAYMYNQMWDEAIQSFTDFQFAKVKMDKESVSPERMIQMCTNAKDLTEHPVNVTFRNLGKTINTPFEEYNPFISADNSTLVFTSRRKGNMGGFIEDLGIYTADVFTSAWKDTIWSKARSMGANVNTEWDEECVGLSPAGDMVILYFDNTEFFGDLGMAPIKGKMWQRSTMLPITINTKSIESGATLSMDGNTLYFSSDRKEGSGKSDIWMVRKENGQWGNPVNVKELNSTDDEINPVLSFDGKTLYFASDGSGSMGGYDIFYSRWNEDSHKWSKPVNIGYPLNDVDDNVFISFSGDGRFAYMSALRPEGLGNLDIYQVEFLDTSNHPFSHVISGSIAGNSGRIEVTKITLEDKSGNKLVYIPTSSNNNFALPASPGDYTVKVEGYNFAPYSDTVTVGNEYPPVEVNKIIQLTATK